MQLRAMRPRAGHHMYQDLSSLRPMARMLAGRAVTVAIGAAVAFAIIAPVAFVIMPAVPFVIMAPAGSSSFFRKASPWSNAEEAAALNAGSLMLPRRA